MKYRLFYFAIIGWLSGLTVHLLSLAGYDVTEKAPFVWILHVGLFAVWLPAILKLKKNEELKAYQKSVKSRLSSPFGLFKIIFRQTPNWLVVIAIAGFFYAVINFALFMTTQMGTPLAQGGQYALYNHGQLIKTLTAQQFHHYKANEMRGFSGHWIAFYGMAAAILFPFGSQGQTVIGSEVAQAR